MKKEEKPQEVVLCNENPFFGPFFMKKMLQGNITILCRPCVTKQRCMGKYSHPYSLYWDLYRSPIKFILTVV